MNENVKEKKNNAPGVILIFIVVLLLIFATIFGLSSITSLNKDASIKEDVSIINEELEKSFEKISDNNSNLSVIKADGYLYVKAGDEELEPIELKSKNPSIRITVKGTMDSFKIIGYSKNAKRYNSIDNGFVLKN